MNKPAKKNIINRRSFFKKAGIGAVAGTFPMVSIDSASEIKRDRSFENFFSKGDIILFQGDSITDAGRDKKNEWANNAKSFGGGYAFLIASELLQKYPEKELTIYNRGISGNKVYQLAERWQKDCLDLHPNILSILIGVNDYWHMRNGNYDGTIKIYRDDLRSLLSKTKDKNPDMKLVICEPFLLSDTKSVDDSWLDPFAEYQETASAIAGEFEAIWVPFQSAFNDALKLAPPAYWTHDGVHPSMAGSSLMAGCWLNAL